MAQWSTYSMTQLTQDSREVQAMYGGCRSAVSLVKRGDVDGRRDLFTVLITWVYIYQTLKSCIFWRFKLFIICQLYLNTVFWGNQRQRTSCQKLQLADSLWSHHICEVCWVHWRVTLCELFPACGWAWPDTSAGSVLPCAAWPRQSCTAAVRLPSSLLSWCQSADLYAVSPGFFFFFCSFTYLYLAVLSLCCCTQAFPSSWQAGATSSCGEWASHRGGFFCWVACAPWFNGCGTWL